MAKIQMVHSSSPEFSAAWNAIINSEVSLINDWLRTLQESGIAAAHPDDGWVDDNENTLTLVYPHYNDGIQVGALVALGTYDKYRVVRLTNRIQSKLTGQVRWAFEVVS